MRLSDQMLNEDGKRIAQRGRRSVFRLYIGTALLYLGLLIYLTIAPQPNLILVELWFAGPGIALSLGITMINWHLNRTLPGYKLPENSNAQATDL